MARDANLAAVHSLLVCCGRRNEHGQGMCATELPRRREEVAGQVETLFSGPVGAPDGPVDARNGISSHVHRRRHLRFGVQTRKMVAAAGFEPATKGWYVIASNDIRGGGPWPMTTYESLLAWSPPFASIRFSLSGRQKSEGADGRD